jgi:hypothetical protein
VKFRLRIKTVPLAAFKVAHDRLSFAGALKFGVELT